MKELKAKIELGGGPFIVPDNPKQVIIKDYNTQELIFQIIRHEIQLKRTQIPELKTVIEQLEAELNERLIKRSDFFELKKYLLELDKIIDKLKQLTIDTTRENVSNIINTNDIFKKITGTIITKQPMKLRERPNSISNIKDNYENDDCNILSKYLT